MDGERPLPEPTNQIAADAEKLWDNAERAAAFLRAFGHERRLKILFQLVGGEKPVNRLEELISARQANVSQHLARLRDEGVVLARRDGKEIYYSLADDRADRVIRLLCDLFCDDGQPRG